MVKILITTLIMFFSMLSNAEVITYTDWEYNSSDEIDWIVTIDDESHADYFTFNIGIGSPLLTGDVLGFAFDISADFALPADLVNFSPYDIGNYNTNSLNCGPGCNFNGATSDNFDHLISIGQQGSGGDNVTTFSFGLEKGDLTLDENLFTRVGIRAQSVGDNCDNSSCDGSVKDISATSMSGSITDVPEPTTVILLGLTLLGLVSRKIS